MIPKDPARLAALCLLFVSCAHGGGAPAREEAFRAYYQGLRALEQDKEESSYSFFETALGSANSRIVEAAAAELILPLLRGDLEAAAFLARLGGGGKKAPLNPPLRPLAAAALYRLDRWEEIPALYGGEDPSAVDSWDRALFLLSLQDSPPPADDRLRSFLFGAPPGPALQWAAGELGRRFPLFLGKAEEAVLEARLATARSSFARGLALFRPVLDEAPELFSQYPALITDLGRCFQFGGDGEDEGIEILLAWEKGAPQALRYPLLYYAGRIARTRGDYRRGAGIFEQALEAAPDGIQEDACIWYILDAMLRDETGDRGGLSGRELADLVKTWLPRCQDPAYFSDILDRVSQRLASSGQWGLFPELFAFLEQYGDPLSRARYAYISGRALSLGLIPEEGASGGEESREAEVRRLFRIAYGTGIRALYYRTMSAYFLGEPLVEPEKKGQARARNFPRREEMIFLLGFFEEGLPLASEPHVEALAGELSLEELRDLGEAMEEAGAYAQAIRTVSALPDRGDYELRRRDLELLSPRPFQELIEAQAREAGLAPELLYGLIRTESAFQPGVSSRAGALGLVQLMPPTAADMAGRMKRRGGPDYTGNLDLRDPEINIAIGAYYLNYLQNLLDHPLSAILAYNGGLSRVRRWRRAQPALPGDLFLETVEYPETREYGRRLVSSAALYGYLYYGLNSPSFLADICR